MNSRFVLPPPTPYERHQAAMANYARLRVQRSPHGPWDRLREDFERDYSRGLLSDNEHDDLFNRWLQEVGAAR